jgi:hypothetical protein
MIRVAPGPAEAAERRRSKAQIANATTAVAATPTIQPRDASRGSRRSGVTDGSVGRPSTTRGRGRPASAAGRVDWVTACRARTFGWRSDAPPFKTPWDAGRVRFSATRLCAASLVASGGAGAASAAGACCTASLDGPPASAVVAAPRAVRPALAVSAAAATRCEVPGRRGAPSASPAPDAGGAAAGADAAGGGGSFVAGGPTGAASARGRNRSGSR